MDLISVIVPVYQVEKYLDRCVGSIADQTYRDLEIILVDDGSPDQCPALCDAWAKKDSRIKVIHQKNSGLSGARNAGLAAAAGEYISFVDSDDWIAPQFIERLLEAIHRDRSDIAACSVEMVWEDGSPSRSLTDRINCVLDRYEAQRELLNEAKLKQPVWYKLYRAAVIKDIPFAEGKVHEDVFWSYQAFGKAAKVSIIDDVGYYYWQRSGSIMGEGYSLRRLDAMEAVCRRYEYFRESFPGLAAAALVSIWEGCIYHGMMALTYLDAKDRRCVFEKLAAIRKAYPIRHRDYRERKLPHRLWISISRISLKGVCMIRRRLRIGY